MKSPFLLQITMTGNEAVADSTAKAVPSEEVVAESSEKMLSLWELTQEGGVVMAIIFVLSVITVYIFVERDAI